MIRWSKPSGVYIMNFYRPKYVTCKKTESGRHTRCPRDRGRALQGGASCPFRTTSFLLKFLNNPKLIKIVIIVVLESVYLPYHIPISFRSLERSGKASRPRLVYRNNFASTIINPHNDCYLACIQCIKLMEKRSNAIRMMT